MIKSREEYERERREFDEGLKRIHIEMTEKCQDINFLLKYSSFLTERELICVKLRHGHIDGIFYTFKSIASLLPPSPKRNIKIKSANRANQIYRKSLRKIKRAEGD